VAHLYYLAKSNKNMPMFTINCRGRLRVVDKPMVMGIINITPDSFYAGSRQNNIDAALVQAEKMLEAGADILDIGGQSTRPGSELIDAAREEERVLPVVAAIYRRWPNALLSIDTFYSRVAMNALAAGACMVNDISGGMMDPEMLTTVANYRAPYICMHMKGTPQTMQHNPRYEDITKEIVDYFIAKIYECKKAGIHDVIIDPGLGFGKTIEHNFGLLKNLHLFSLLQKPVLVGLSRKSFIGKILGVPASEALNGTTALHMLALQNGASLLRVHDVKEAVEAVKLFQEYAAC
jgi:dihydropteroate synthase